MGDATQPTHEVFISYSKADKRWADAACAVLEAHRIRCWIAPRDITPGTEWGASIIAGIDGCKLMVLIFSTHANESPQVRREVERVISKGLTVLPCRVEDVKPVGAMEYALSNTHWLEAFTPPVERQMNLLAQSVQALLRRDSGAAQVVPPRNDTGAPSVAGGRPLAADSIGRKKNLRESSSPKPAWAVPTATPALASAAPVSGGRDRTIVDKAAGRESMAPGPENKTKGLAKARQLVRKPAIAMLVAGILGLLPSLLMTFIGAILCSGVTDLERHTGHENQDLGRVYFLLFFPLAAAAAVAIAAAISMMKLRRYRLCVWGSFTVMPAGGLLILLGMPVGIWSLMTLRIPGMRSAFTLNEERVRIVGESIDALGKE